MQIGLVGATNVGKSTLFNRLIGQFRAIVTDIPGTTRDILYHTALIDNIGKVVFADSPGLEFNDEWPFIQEIIDSSDLVLFMIDDKTGITSKEEHIIEYIRGKNKQKQTILIVNKLDLKRKESETSLALTDYHKLGFKHTIGISAKNYRNLDLLQEEILILMKS
ncbi:50S ribosome-binding GTPase [Patescibacteria group bacterium]|nr:50S ribosome-binding GTPase [Patescibacteria group bacterium]MBU1757613.1 50S ribosome-binding GTPase [Patescibacteria group bacterium]